MRIRSIKPEFWRSEDIKQLSREDRLLFIGLWSYVDDNGVGVDSYRQIAADLFALEDDPREVRDFVSEGLARLSRVLLITRYEVAGKRFLFINSWDKHQRIDRPSKPRYPRPAPGTTSTDPEPSPVDTSDTRGSREGLDAGAGEQGNRGTEETHPPVDAEVLAFPALVPAPKPAAYPAEFESAWAAYERKGAKKTAYAEWKRAVKRAPMAAIVAAIPAYIDATPDTRYRKDFERWLKGDCWESAVVTSRPTANGHRPYQDPINENAYFEDIR